jgi:hypothetical protein
MSDEDAAALIADMFGFAPDRIEIRHGLPVWECNKHGKIRKTGSTCRGPLYVASDRNYIAFRCGRIDYEYFDDDLCIITE